MTDFSSPSIDQLTVIVPAAGVGKRMQANCPKQYLKVDELTILEHTVLRLLSHPKIRQVIIAISATDEYFADTLLASHQQVTTVMGGNERVDSVLAGLQYVAQHEQAHINNQWILVHDAARPCITHNDITALINSCQQNNEGGLLAYPVKDTMKRADNLQQVATTVDRSALWHALTPQMYPTTQLLQSIMQAQDKQQVITDESSAIELAGFNSLLVEGSSENIKITRPEDLALAQFYLTKQQETPCV